MLLYKEDSVEKQMFAFFAMTILDVIMWSGGVIIKSFHCDWCTFRFVKWYWESNTMLILVLQQNANYGCVP